MNILKTLFLASCILALTSCNKTQAIPSDKQNFVGVWEPEEPVTDETLEITVNADGTGSYNSSKPGKQVTATGNVFFINGNEFTIGGKVFRKKIYINRAPVKQVESIKPYKYHYTATFDDIKFKKKE